MRRQSHRYQTFPTTPPKTPLEQPSPPSDASSTASEDDNDETPLPVRQLLLLAFLSLAEQTALNSISPYLPDMVVSMPGIPPAEAGLYVGILASAFALAQLSTNFLWGYASDVIGRKPVLIMGTFALMCCFCVFGLCKQYWQIVVVHVAMGLLNGNAACVPTVLGEVTDRSNQSRAFTYLPVIYSLGSITGPALGGILVGKVGNEFPYLAPNILAAALLACSVVVVGIWFEETLDKSQVNFELPAWVQKVLSWLPSRKPPPRRHSWSARWPRARSHTQPLLSTGDSDDSDDEAEDDDDEDTKLDPARSTWKELTGTTILVLCTYLVFQLSNISFNSLYPIFAATPPPAGRDLLPSNIGVSLSVAGLASIIFQAFLFQPFKTKMGNLGTYQLALLGLGISMVLMPWVGYADDKPLFGVGSGKLWLYLELGVVLILKNLCAVGGLSSVMLLVSCLLCWTVVNSTNMQIDYELCPITRESREPERSGADPFRPGSQHWALCVWCPVYAVNSHPSQGRGPGMESVRRPGHLRLDRFLVHPWRWPRERRLGRLRGCFYRDRVSLIILTAISPSS